MTKDELKAVMEMYKALMQIACVNRKFFVSDFDTLSRAQEIANKCLTNMNSVHSDLVAKIFEKGD